MKKLLFVSYNHGYNNVADSVQNHRLIPALSKYYDIDVLQRRTKGSPDGVWSPSLYILDRIIYKLFPYLISVFSLDRWMWCKLAYKSIKKTLLNYDYVIMVYEPYTIRFLQYIIKRETKRTKVISILYDPYLDNIFLSQSKQGIRLRRRIERKIVANSDVTVTTSDKVLKIFKQRYPQNNISSTVFCGLNSLPSFFFTPSNKKDGLLTLVHAGNIYGVRRIDEVNNVITQLKNLIPNLSSCLNIIILGTYCVGYEKVKMVGNDDVIAHRSPLYGENFMKCIKEADGLLLVDPLDSGNTCFPSKLCEYYQYKKPIFGLSAKNTPSYDSLKESGHIVCDGDELCEMVQSLYAYIKNPSFLNNKFDDTYGDKYYPGMVAGSLKAIIDSLG